MFTINKCPDCGNKLQDRRNRLLCPICDKTFEKLPQISQKEPETMEKPPDV